MKLFQIKAKLTGNVVFEFKCKSLKICVEKSVSTGADLRGADLTGADLTGADLTGADLTGADLRGADLRGADLRGADLRGADLTGADLRGAYLRGADLRGAYLRGAYLRGAYGERIKITEIPLQILGLQWDILIFDSHLKIGCEFHTISEWSTFDDNKINDMDHRALEFWKASKDFILSFCKSNGRG